MIEKKCSKCKEKKPATAEFFYKHKGKKDGFHCECKKCRKKYNQRPEIKKYRREYIKEWDKKNRDKNRNYKLKRKYGISLDIYNTLYDYYKGKCRICGKKEDILSVDHNHKNGKLRGLLCKKCNSVLGLSNDNPLILYKAIKYLKGE